ncbi:MAG: AMP-binding protein [Crocinitomicaceae bacterium]
MTPEFITNNDKLITEVNGFIAEWQSSSLIIAVKTSGSTGTPKLIELRKSNMVSSAQMTGRFFDLKKGESILLNMSPKTIGGIMIIVRAIVLDLKLIVVDVTSTPLIQIKNKVDIVSMVPMQLKASIETSPDKFDLIRTLIIGGGVISNTLENQIKNLKCDIYHTFGMTETISHIALRDLKSDNSYFQTLNEVNIETENDCLVISAAALGINRLVTNDIVELKSKTSFKWLGRSDFAINSGGIKIIPSIIERRLSTLIHANLFSFGLPDMKLGQRHILVIESTSDLKLKKSDFNILDNYMTPKEIYYLDKFSYTQSGKINKLLTIESLGNAKKQVL